MSDFSGAVDQDNAPRTCSECSLAEGISDSAVLICLSNTGISPSFNRSLEAWWGNKSSSRDSSFCHNSSSLSSAFFETSGAFFLICSVSYMQSIHVSTQLWQTT